MLTSFPSHIPQHSKLSKFICDLYYIRTIGMQIRMKNVNMTHLINNMIITHIYNRTFMATSIFGPCVLHPDICLTLSGLFCILN